MRKAKVSYGALLACLLLIGSPAKAEAPIVAAAADLQFALTEAAEQFQQQTGHALRLNFGSSGNFRHQIAQGAPFELYLSADERYVQALYEEGYTQDEGVIYAIGRLAWLQRAGRGDLPNEETPLEAVKTALEAGTTERIALANPEHAPYGVAAQQALEHVGLWEQTEPLRILGENVSQAAQFALSDDARGGLVAYSLALAPSLGERSEYVLIPEDWHSPLRQRMVLTHQAGDIATAFYEWLQEDEAQSILRIYGFSVE
ncbi:MULTISPECIES: molybdate ABC transporter substrate-binding protein [unclassified Halomonas]|uniref:molybdate ABC transporter substrate-binding protein n=1 Tax=unclassified Halomonas TaxID=2609666 RepID=UPI001CF55E47|nr:MULTISPECIES: molybdate ABC transporter substrate-binding protein [unclassified Halomonas]MCA8863690.1 molybdate ABC transporter substrate-binding protein [Halomonas sp. SBBP1]UZH09002.1 molybdate ABC transporter substrate-binding protein [Halomonas sp. BDJS001]